MQRGSSLLGAVAGPWSKKGPSTNDGFAKKLPVASIVPDPDQPRRVFDSEAIAALAENIRATGGLIHPLIVREIKEEGERERYYLIAGERRWRAIRQLGWSHVDTVVRTIEDPYQIRLIQTAENRQRLELNVEEEAENARSTLELGISMGKTQRDVAEDMGYDRNVFSRLLAVNNATAQVRELIRAGKTRSVELIGYLTHISELDSTLFTRITDPELIQLHLARDVVWAVKNGYSAAQVIEKLDSLPVGSQRLGVRPVSSPATPEDSPATDVVDSKRGEATGSSAGTSTESASSLTRVSAASSPSKPLADEPPAADTGDSDRAADDDAQDPGPEARGAGQRRTMSVPSEMIGPELGRDVYTHRQDDEDAGDKAAAAAASDPTRVSTRLGPVTELDVRLGDEVVSVLLNDPRTDGTRAACLYADGRIEVVDLAQVTPVLLSLARRA